MHQVIFYPVQNGDTSQIILSNGKRLLLDFHHLTCGEDDDKPAIDLKSQLEAELAKANRDYFDVVAFTHGDRDHIWHSTEFFELWHSSTYQGNGRIKIKELWVPAAMLIESSTPQQRSSEFVIWRQEARHRLRQGKGIRVFSKPEMLKTWFEDNGLTLESRRHLITDAGKRVPDSSFSLACDGVEFFCHSPFVKHVDEGEDLRNDASLIFQIRFQVAGVQTNYLAVGDSTCDVLEDIVRTTKWHGNEDRLKWDLFNIPHHCSYRALNSEKGEKETIPLPLVEELLLHGQKDAYLVSSSKVIENTDAAYEQKLPPHIQAKNCYEKYLTQVGGRRFIITMDKKGLQEPQPLVFHITSQGINLDNSRNARIPMIITSPAPRAGC